MSLVESTERTLAALLRDQADRHGTGAALLAPGRTALSYAGLWRQASDLAAALHALGVTAASPVALVLPNGPEMASAFLGTAMCARCLPLNPACQAAELRFGLQDLRAEVLVVRAGEPGPAVAVARELGVAVLELEWDAASPAGRFVIVDAPTGRVPAPCRPGERDIALVLHTSGTTARPKTVPLSQANLLASAHAIARHLALTPRDRCLNVMPLFHIHGLVGALLATLAAGASIVCTPGFDADAFFGWAGEFDASWYTAVPTIHQSVVGHGARYRQQAPAHRFRVVRSSSAALPPTLYTQLRELTGAPVVEAYGMTEASHQMACNPLPPGICKPGSVGVASGAEIAVMDEHGRLLGPDVAGEIVIRGPGVFAGYGGHVEADTRAFTNGWFRTGDLGRLDSDGYLFIAGRLKEIVNRGGEKISPREIDEALLEHRAVAQAVAFPVPHPTLGEDLAAAVVLHDAAAADEAALRAFLLERLAHFKLPSTIVVVDAIPKGPTGKISRAGLHQSFAGRLSTAHVGARTELERAIEAIFRVVLGAADLGVDDNFFAVGGDSLKATQIVARINAAQGVGLRVLDVFAHPTIAQLAAAVESARAIVAAADTDLVSEIAQLSDDEVERLLAQAETEAESGGSPA